MAREIREMEPGDFVKTGPGKYEKIASVSPGVAKGQPLPRHFHVVTENGRVGMFQALRYYKKDDPRP